MYHISSTLENEELFDPKVLEVSCVKLEPWLEDEAMISKWKKPSCKTRTMAWKWSHDLQMKKPFHLSEKWKREKNEWEVLPVI